MDQVRGQPRRDAVAEGLVHRHPQALPLEPGVLDDPSVVLPAGGEEVARVLAAAGHRAEGLPGEGILTRELLLEVLGIQRRAVGGEVLIDVGLVHETRVQGILPVPVPELELVQQVEGPEPLGEVDPALPRLSPLRGDEDHPVRRSGSVEGRRGGAFQDLDPLDVLGIQVHDPVHGIVLIGPVRPAAGEGDVVQGVGDGSVGHHDPVHDVEGLQLTVDGRGAPEPHLDAAAGRSRVALDVGAGDLALEVVLHAGRRRGVLDLVGGHRGHGIGQISPGHAGGLTRHDDALEVEGILVHGHPDVVGRARHGDGRRPVSEVLEPELHLSRGNGDGESTLTVADGLGAGADLGDDGRLEGLAELVDHHPVDLPDLGLQHVRKQACQEEDGQRPNKECSHSRLHVLGDRTATRTASRPRCE